MDLIKSVVNWMKMSDDVILQSCADCLSEIISSEAEGVVTQLVQLVGDLVKRQKCKCDPRAVQPLLSLKFHDLPATASEGTSLNFLEELFCREAQENHEASKKEDVQNQRRLGEARRRI